MRWLGYITPFVIAVVFMSCSTIIKSTKISALSADYCAPNIAYAKEDVTDSNVFSDTILSKRLSLHDYNLATHLELLPLLAQLARSNSQLEKLATKLKVSDKILQFQTEINSVASELDCNGERWDQLARVLDARNSKRSTRLTVGSIVVGAAVALSTALINIEDLNKAINIGGGIAGAGLGFLLLNPKGKKVELKMQRSLLKNIWAETNADNSFPPALWRVMSDKSFSNEKRWSLIQTLKRRWLLSAFEGNISSRDEELYFGKGGYFSSDDIHLMSDMTNELQASVRTVQQDLLSLVSSVNRWQ